MCVYVYVYVCMYIYILYIADTYLFIYFIYRTVQLEEDCSIQNFIVLYNDNKKIIIIRKRDTNLWHPTVALSTLSCREEIAAT